MLTTTLFVIQIVCDIYNTVCDTQYHKQWAIANRIQNVHPNYPTQMEIS